MAWNFLGRRPVRLGWALGLIIATTAAISTTFTDLDDQLSSLNISNHVEIDQLLIQWGNNAGVPGFKPQPLSRIPHPKELFARQVRCPGGKKTCSDGTCCRNADPGGGEDFCCGGTLRCCSSWCCGGDDRCPTDRRGCEWPTRWITSTTTVVRTASPVTQTSSVSGTTTNWVTSKVTSTIVATTSNVATATQVVTKVVTVTDATAAAATPTKRAAYVDTTPAAHYRHVRDPDHGSESVPKHVYYLRRSPQLDMLANALQNRGLSVLRRDWVTSTTWITSTNQAAPTTIVNTVTDWRILTSTSMLTDTITSTSYIGAATTVTSTTTSTTRVAPGFTPPSSTASSQTPTATPEANTSGNSGSDGKPNIAPIVGGTVGGVAGLALIGAIIFVIKRRRHWAAQDADNDRKTRTSTLGMPEGKPDYGNSGRGAAAGWGESTTAGATSASAPSWTSDPASRTGSGMAMSGQWQPPPGAPMAQQQMGHAGTSPVEHEMYAHEQRSLSGQWYPQQPPQQLDSGEVAEMPGSGPEQLGHSQYGHGQQSQPHWGQGHGQGYGGHRY